MVLTSWPEGGEKQGERGGLIMRKGDRKQAFCSLFLFRALNILTEN